MDVSVVIPTRNRAHQLRRCLQALVTQTHPQREFEVIVVDDGSDVSVEGLVSPFRAHLQLRLIEQKNAGPADARNAGAAHAVGRLLAFTDDDCEPHPDWVASLYAAFISAPSEAIGGRTLNACATNLFSTASQLMIDFLRDEAASAAVTEGRVRAVAFYPSNNLAVPTALFRQVGGFDRTFPLAAGEDRNFCYSWQDAGLRLRPALDAIVMHRHELSPTAFWQQHVNYGRGAFHLRAVRAAKGASAIPFEPISFYVRLVTFPLRSSHISPRAPLVVLMFASQVANAVGIFLEKRRHWRRRLRTKLGGRG